MTIGINACNYRCDLCNQQQVENSFKAPFVSEYLTENPALGVTF